MNDPVKSPTVAVVGGGFSGLAAAHYLRRIALDRGLNVQVVLFERESRAGGKFDSQAVDGYIVEAGPNGFLDSKPWTLQLVRELGMDSEILPSDQSAARRFIYSRGRLHEIKPPPAFLLSGLLSLPSRVGMIRELFARPTPAGQDTTLAEFGRRRLGSEVVQRLLDPMVSGIFAGDPERMSLRASFPRIAQIEEDYGGLMRGWARIARERKAAKKRGEDVGVSSGPSGPGGVLTSFREGVAQLTDRLAGDLGGNLHCGTEVLGITRGSDRFRVHTGSGEYTADAVILATPAPAASRILGTMAPGSGELLSRIPYSPMAVVGLGYDLPDLQRPPSGFGYLIPRVENRRILGALWTSSIFPGHRSPEGKFLIRVMVGGARDHETPFLPDDTLLETVKAELAATMNLAADPSFIRIIRWKEAIPLYTVGHLDRVAEAERGLPPRVVLAGNAYRGVGINDCSREAEAAAVKTLDALL